ncbi:MAG: peptidyl-prolyl cis-trans isomerase [Acidobacteria bacterium]|nr:peptidyl-prolyl cis-trans isomerase [Acidobacteriota bacterium]
MKTWLREPLVHFLILGSLLFAIGGLFGPRGATDISIVVSEAQVSRLAELFASQWQRPPTLEELDGLVEQHIREEVLYREGIAMRLDQNDTIVRRRIVQKLEFLSQDLVDENPSEGDLRAYFEANPERFMEPAEVSFEHVFLNPDDRGDAIEADAQTTVEVLTAGADPASVGDRFLLPGTFQERSTRELGGLFGAGFAETLATLAIGDWVGPVQSGYGAHVVRVTARRDAFLPDFGATRDKVRVEYLATARRDADVAMYEDLRGRYRIEVAELPNAEGAAE